MTVKKNRQLTVKIEDLTHEGMGVAKVEGYPLFIENALPGEEVLVHVVKAGKKFGFAKVIDYLTESHQRVSQTDDVLIRTGIAPLSHLTYEQQLLFKQTQVKRNLSKIAQLDDVSVLETIGMTDPWQYRNKAQVPFRRVNGRGETGFYRKNSHDLIPIEDYQIQHTEIDKVIAIVRDALNDYRIKPYNEEEHTGLIRHIIVRRGFYTGEMMVGFVTRTKKFFDSDRVVKKILEQAPEVTTIVQNINEDKTNVILGNETVTLYGDGVIHDRLFDKTYRLSLNSFFQVNTQQAEVLYEQAMNFAELNSSDIVIDAYCGIGTIGMSLANRVAHVYGMDVVPQAIADAKENQKLNDIKNVTFETGKAEEVLPSWVAEGIKANVLIVDPPRKGLDPSFIETACELAPDRIVYVSCHPGTFARDVKLFGEKGYELTKVQPVDMFPQTTHVECVALMSKVDE